MPSNAAAAPARVHRFAASLGGRLSWHAAPAEKAVVAALLAFALIFVLGNYEFFAAPPPDFLSFRAVAASFARLEFPDSFKRAPAYPAAMALVRLVSPGPDPFLTAANVVNVLAALGVLALTYYWTKPRLGRWAPLAAALVGTYSQFPQLATVPLCEMLYLLLILAAVASAGRGNGWAYLWAGAAAATRYEALALVPLLALFDAGRWRRRPRLLLYAALAAVPAVGWFLIGYARTGSLNPYVDEIQALSASGWAFPRALAASFYPPAGPAQWAVAAAFAAVAAAGCVKLAARGGAGERVYLGFAVIYTLIHVVFPFSFGRFVFPVWPLLVLAFLEGGRLLLAAAGRLRLGRWWYAVAAVLGGAFAAALGWRLAAWRAGPPDALALAGLAALAGLVACVAWGAAGAPFTPRRWALGAAALVAVGLFAAGNFRAYAAEREAVKHYREALKEAALWLKGAAAPDDVVVAADPALFGYYFGPAGPRARSPASFGTDDFAVFAARARREGVTYVCYDSLSGRNPEGYFAAEAGAGVLEPLGAGRDVGRVRFIARLEASGEYVNVYRLAAEPPGWKPPGWDKEREE
jgi:hypothetical protein